MSWQARAMPAQTLDGLRVLVVDDEAIIALDIETALAEAGAVVIGPAGDVGEALALVSREQISAAVLDVRLSGETVEPVAAALFDLDVPFIFYSGQMQSDVSFLRWPKATFVAKPSPFSVLTEAVRRAHAAGKSS